MMEQRLEKLLIEKRFTSLSTEERQYALKRLTKNEYDQYRDLLLGAKLALAPKGTGVDSIPKPNKALGKALLARQGGKDRVHLIDSRRNSRRVLLAAVSLVVGFATLGTIWLTFRTEDHRNAAANVATQYLKNGMDQKIMIGMDSNNTNDSITNGYLLSNDSLFRALDAMNDYMVIRQDGPRSHLGRNE